MSANTTNLMPPVVGATANLEQRFILTQVERLTLVLPATWVTEIIRIDRSQILDLPFYDPLLVGIANRHGRIVPLIATDRLLEVATRSLPERVVVVLLEDRGDRELGNVGLIVDRAIGSSRREELPPALFTASRTESMVTIRSDLVPTTLWQPKYWSIDN
ncbi:chemotaxis protein CheW [Chamaesiphon sp. GL140_3_metabinner_50]|uniref:chemotaxis protein CheW n=1 Tax=Chamaesiphon sp. GL140_3_metabinner_50 TaxID=2970812 RepID=UPI0025FCC89D|nr:chemotaxis protein CheW [Chamaesiphon sp. GL140_3_metabinner_50]